MNKITKLLTNPIKAIDEEARQAQYIISTDDVDRCGEIVEQKWELDNYKKNPIVLFGHDPSKADNVLGKCIEFETAKDGDRTITKATVQFAEEGTSSTADTVWKLVKQGILRTVSVGFIPHSFKNEDSMDEPTILSDNELLEFSLVPLPANPNAVALAYQDGTLTKKDAKFLLNGYQKEAKLLEQALCDTIKATTDSSKEGAKAMSDEDITKLAEAVGTAVSETLAPKFDEILAKLDDGEDADEEKPEEPADETPDGDQMAGDDGKKPEDDDEDDEDKEPKKNAKSEQNDEDGAFDENEELDEEAEKAFLADLEKEYNEQNA